MYTPALLNVNLLNVALPFWLVTVSSYEGTDLLACSSLILKLNSPLTSVRPSSCFSTSGVTVTGSDFT